MITDGTLLDFIVPRFKTEPFCLNTDETGEALDVICPFCLREEGERFDALMDISYLNFFGFCLFSSFKYDTFRKFTREHIR